jgi:hypothetical protein
LPLNEAILGDDTTASNSYVFGHLLFGSLCSAGDAEVESDESVPKHLF